MPAASFSWNSFIFEESVGAYPTPTWLRNRSDGLSTYMPLDDEESNIKVYFDEYVHEDMYITFYDVTMGRYMTTGAVNGLDGPYPLNYTWTISGLYGGHTYRMGFATESGVKNISGYVTSY